MFSASTLTIPPPSSSDFLLEFVLGCFGLHIRPPHRSASFRDNKFVSLGRGQNTLPPATLHTLGRVPTLPEGGSKSRRDGIPSRRDFDHPSGFFRHPSGFFRHPSGFLGIPPAFLGIPPAFLTIPPAFLGIPPAFLTIPPAFFRHPAGFFRHPSGFFGFFWVFFRKHLFQLKKIPPHRLRWAQKWK